jgi:hypothetical protein
MCRWAISWQNETNRIIDTFIFNWSSYAESNRKEDGLQGNGSCIDARFPVRSWQTLFDGEQAQHFAPIE